MKKIRLHVNKIKNNFYAKIPTFIAEKINLSNGNDIEVSIFDNEDDNQVELWKEHIEDINQIIIEVKNDVHTMNMYNRIYVPEMYRFFLPNHKKEFILFTCNLIFFI